jgi:glutaminyl-peptide cyclotransferase
MTRLSLLLTALLLGAPLMSFLGCSNNQAADGPSKPRVEFAEDRGGVAVPEGKAVAFEGKRAMEYLKAICALGPRMSGTDGMKQQQELIRKHFEVLGFRVQEQAFTARQTSQKKPVEMMNLIVSVHPERRRRVILCSHYDTRPIADQERDSRRWREPFVSANDGGSGVALLMELGRHLEEMKCDVGIDLVFFDGEEYIFERERDRYFFGSQHFAQAWQRSKDRPVYLGAVLLDMVAGKNARFPFEGHSIEQAQQLCLQLWGIAAELRCNAFVRQVDQSVLDDHLALLKAGIPAVDIIDFSYAHWHRLSDTPDNCAPEPMEQVARVLSVWLQNVR